MKNNKRGYLLPMVIIYMIITMIVGAGILALGSLDRIEANRRLHREQAFYLAEAGINYAYYRLKSNPSDNLTGSHVFGTVAFQISDTVTGDTRTIVSTGTIKNVNETVAINVTKGGGSKLFGQGLFGTLGVIMQENTYIDSYDSRIPGSVGGGYEGDVGSNTTIEIPNNATVQGHALSAGGPGSVVLGIQNELYFKPPTEDAPVRILDPVPMVVPADLLGPLSSPTITPSGNYTLTAGVDGVLTIKKGKTVNISGGNFRFKEIRVEGGPVTTLNFTGTVRIYVTDFLTTENNSIINFTSGSFNELYMGDSPGSITMDNNSTMATPAPSTALGIYVVGNADLQIANNAAAPFYAVIYAPLATVSMRNGSELWGNIVANEIFLRQNTTVHYNVALQSSLPPGDPGGVSAPAFISWTKPNWKIE